MRFRDPPFSSHTDTEGGRIFRFLSDLQRRVRDYSSVREVDEVFPQNLS